MKLPLVIYILLLIELLIVAYIDFKTKKISNYWAIVNILIFIFNAFIFADVYLVSWMTFFFPLVFLLVGFALFALKIMGPGDSKFLFSFFLSVPVGLHEEVFLSLGYATLAIGILLMVINIIRNFQKIVLAFRMKDVTLIKGIFGKKFSYAPVICISWIWFGITHFQLIKF